MATMFWLERLIRLLRPMPPTPTAAIFSVSLGAVRPRPSTCRGTMAKPADVAATLDTKLRLEIRAMISLQLVLTDRQPDDTPCHRLHRCKGGTGCAGPCSA